MNKYELVVIVDAVSPQQDKENILKETCEIITKNEGKLVNSQVWVDKHKLPFRLKRSTEGTYYLINFEAPSSAALKIRQLLKINEKVLRFLLLNMN
jgi:small subunit ribosomal protein S6